MSISDRLLGKKNVNGKPHIDRFQFVRNTDGRFKIGHDLLFRDVYDEA